jgi:hypothetical protein
MPSWAHMPKGSTLSQLHLEVPLLSGYDYAGQEVELVMDY